MILLATKSEDFFFFFEFLFALEQTSRVEEKPINNTEEETTSGGKNGMNDGKLGNSFSRSSFEIPSSAFFILCCILSRRTYKDWNISIQYEREGEPTYFDFKHYNENGEHQNFCPKFTPHSSFSR